MSQATHYVCDTCIRECHGVERFPFADGRMRVCCVCRDKETTRRFHFANADVSESQRATCEATR